MTVSSQLLEAAVNELSRLPGIGKKTALRMALHLLRQEQIDVERFGSSIIRMRQEIVFCDLCHNISDTGLCHICANDKRDAQLICVVQDIRDVIAVENTGQFNGVYHVLGGIISPIEGIGPDDLFIHSLIERVQNGSIREIIMALPSTVEGDTTIFYIYRKLQEFDILFSTIARGISVGDELEYTDEITLGRSIADRLPYGK